MRYLVLGGTQFVGRHIVSALLDAGHSVTLFTRGRTNPDLFPDAEHLRGDRDGDLSALEGRSWDRAIDVNAYVPRVVRRSAELLQDAVQHLTFVSTVSVYPRWVEVGEDSPTVAPETADEEITSESYGRLKVACEDVIREVFGRRALVVRPGIVVGPHDPTDRFTYWVARTATGGDVAVPGDPERLVQIVDARDLGEWIGWMSMRRRPGVYNAAGPDYRLSFGRLLSRIRAVTGADASFHWVADDKIEAEVEDSLPLWSRAEDGGRFDMDVDSTRARWEGLLFRPLAETIRDTLAWDRSRGEESARRAGPSEDVERDLVARAGRRT